MDSFIGSITFAVSNVGCPSYANAQKTAIPHIIATIADAVTALLTVFFFLNAIPVATPVGEKKR